MSQALLKRIEARTARIAVLGIGYVGLPLALLLAKRGFHVVGCDTDHERISKLRFGRSPFAHIKDSDVAHAITSDDLTLVETGRTGSHVPISDVYIICVPTPLQGTERRPDLSMVNDAFATVADAISLNSRPALVILESTVMPGCTRLMAMKHFSGRIDNVLVAYSPEREDPGNPLYHTSNIPKLCAGMTYDAMAAAKAMYSVALAKTRVVEVECLETAEMAKLWENTFRQINIAAANELKKICRHMGLDVWRVLEAAASKPFGFMPFRPGPGVGGHCIPIDPIYLLEAAKNVGVDAALIRHADAINAQQPKDVAESVIRELNAASIDLATARILVLGVAYKPNTEDTRESPAYALYQHLKYVDAAAIDWADPLAHHFAPEHSLKTSVDRAIIPEKLPMLPYDCAVILVDQKLDYQHLLDKTPIVIDTCGATSSAPLLHQRAIPA